ncbi:MAG: pilus assembly protein PilY [Burkholderiales bacterium]|nr:pilus assembly protein PilY [Burkholderiales bacterium]
MTKFAIKARFLVALLLGLAGAFPARAYDIDIYSKVGGAAPVQNVLIVLDNTANNDANVAGFTCGVAGMPGKTLLDLVYCSLYQAVAAINPSMLGKLNVAVMVSSTSSTNGGTMLYPVTPPYAWQLIDNTTTLGSLEAPILAGIPKASGNSKMDQVMNEAWAYYTGHTGPSGTSYASHLGTASCQQNFVIYVGATQASAAKPCAGGGCSSAAALASAGASSAQQKIINLTATPNFGPNTKYQNGSFIDEWARYMNQSAGIVTYSVAAGYSPSGAANLDYQEVLQSTAYYGGGKYYASKSGADLVNDLISIFNEIQAVNSEFASPTLPVTANAQGQYLNQVFVGMFRPDGNALPRWRGNLKQYQIVSDSTGSSLYLADALGNAAISSSGTGFFSANAQSFWTSYNPNALPDKSPMQGFWWLDPYFVALNLGPTGGYDSPDGQFVEKGGVGEQIRLANLTTNYSSSPSGPRKVLTDIGIAPGASLVSFDSTNSAVVAAMGGSTSLVNWLRGDDNQGDEVGPGSPVTIRPSVHGDVVHSRPAAVNYGGSTGVVVYYGDNGGMFHAVNGNQPAGANCTVSATCNINGVAPGGELWAFLAKPFTLSQLTRLQTNSPEVALSTTTVAGATPKDYYFDGSPSFYQNGSTVYLYLSERRGGRMIYALDVSTPQSPKLMWTHSSSDTGFAELGQTWSQPKVARLKGYSTNPVLIFGAGYDLNEDSEPPAADTMGRGLFIVDAVTGALVWHTSYNASAGTSCTGNPCSITMPYAIPSDVTLVDRNGDGYIDRVYAADIGGNVWRLDLEPVSATGGPSTWQVQLLASVGGSGTTKRKLYYPPDVVETSMFDAVLVGTGDREHPLLSQQSYNVVNRLYMIKDFKTGMSGAGATPVVDDSSSTANNAPSATAALFDATTTPYPSSLVTANTGTTKSNGFYVTLTHAGEKVVNGPLAVGAYVYFGTNTPKAASTTSCNANLGEARGYQLSWVTGAGTSDLYDGGGLPPSPVFGVVSVKLGDSGNYKQVPFLIGGPPVANCKGAECVQRPTILPNAVKHRTYWYREIDR